MHCTPLGMALYSVFLHSWLHSQWGDAMFFCFFSHGATFYLQKVEADIILEGRFLPAQATIDDNCFFITNVYAPTDYCEKTTLYPN